MSKYNLVGQDGNAFALMGYTAKALRAEGLGELVDGMRKEATSGDYENLIAVCDKYVTMANTAAGCDDEDDYYDDDEDDEEEDDDEGY